MITITNEIYYNGDLSFQMTKTLMIVFVLSIVTLTVAALAYTNDIANAKKLTSANQLSAPRTTNCHGNICKLTGANHISTSRTTSCDGNACQMLVCINNKCHGSKLNQASNSTIPWTEND
ncbi:MAG: hypothetical protein WA364_12840 [Candidatus Nitrosopolaris sp.]